MPTAPNRWESLLSAKPIPLVEHLLEEISKLLSKELGTWPPPIESLDEQAGKGFRPIFSGEGARPSLSAYEQSFRLARWELARDFEAYDDYLRNRRWLEKGLAAGDKPALLCLSRWLVERMLALREETQGRISRQQLIDCLERTWTRLRSA
jgi:hypothetical protein